MLNNFFKLIRLLHNFTNKLIKIIIGTRGVTTITHELLNFLLNIRKEK